MSREERRERNEDAKAAIEAERAAKECEERAIERSNLAAQWRSVVAGEDAVRIADSERLWTKVESGLLLISVLATIAAAWAAVLASRAAQASVVLAERDLIERDRPEFAVLLEEQTIEGGLLGRETAFAKLKVKNTGGRQATVRFADAEMFILEGEPPIPSHDSLRAKMTGRHLTVEVGGDFPLTAFADSLSDSEREDIIERRKHIFVVGYLEFEDRMGGQWESGFCFWFWFWGVTINRETGARVGIGGRLMRWSAPEHNFDRRRKPEARRIATTARENGAR